MAGGNNCCKTDCGFTEILWSTYPLKVVAESFQGIGQTSNIPCTIIEKIETHRAKKLEGKNEDAAIASSSMIFEG